MVKTSKIAAEDIKLEEISLDFSNLDLNDIDKEFETMIMEEPAPNPYAPKYRYNNVELYNNEYTKKKPKQTSNKNKIVPIIVGIVIIGGFAYAIYKGNSKFIKRIPDTVAKESMKKTGTKTIIKSTEDVFKESSKRIPTLPKLPENPRKMQIRKLTEIFVDEKTGKTIMVKDDGVDDGTTIIYFVRDNVIKNVKFVVNKNHPNYQKYVDYGIITGQKEN